MLAQKSPRVARKVITEVKPAYPATLKNLHIEGLVRLTVTVLPNGNVANINVRGGNPILVENALKAVKNWKYAPGFSQTEEEVDPQFQRQIDRYRWPVSFSPPRHPFHFPDAHSCTIFSERELS